MNEHQSIVESHQHPRRLPPDVRVSVSPKSPRKCTVHAEEALSSRCSAHPTRPITTSPLSPPSSPIHRRIAEVAVNHITQPSQCSEPLSGRARARPAPSPPAAESLRYVRPYASPPVHLESKSIRLPTAADNKHQWPPPSPGTRMGCIVRGWDGAGYLDSFTEGIPLSFELASGRSEKYRANASFFNTGAQHRPHRQLFPQLCFRR